MIKRFLSISAVVAMVAAVFGVTPVTPAAAANGSVNIAGTAGEIVDPDATFSGFMLRYVGDPAPDGYAHTYQWDNPYIETHPDDGPVTFEGTLDLTNREDDNSVAMIGLLDKATLENGDHGFQTGAYIYVNNRANGSVRIGPTDGNTGGEIVQTFHTIPATTADAGPIGVTFIVDGTADPTTCANPASDAATADGCMTLDIDGFTTLTDSYGSRTGSGGSEEFATGAIPGWDVFPSEGSETGYDFDISPADADPQNMDQCKNGGWQDYGFANQGQCIRFVLTGQDSR